MKPASHAPQLGGITKRKGDLLCVVWTSSPPSVWSFVNTLASAYGARCEIRNVRDARDADAVIADRADETLLCELQALSVPTLAIGADPDKTTTVGRFNVRFNPIPRVAWPFHGTFVSNPLPISGARPPLLSSMDVVAWADDNPVWATQTVDAVRHDVISFGFPPLRNDETACDRCKGSEFVATLPLLFLFREMMLAAGWRPPPLQACFMFDDPNLHASTYGFVNYHDIARDALRHRYHVAFATIPLDCWFVHRPVAALFSQYHSQLSLLIHGNDHTFCELAKPYRPQERGELLDTALRRIERFEKVSGVSVARVMAAPHGACSEAMLGGMAAAGFDAACISPWSLRDHNPDRPWISRLGLVSSEWIAGLPVMPRFKLSAGCHIQARLAALLNQPIIAMGHHHDLAGGISLLSAIAEAINGLGCVQWLDLDTIAQQNVWRRTSGSELSVRPYSRRFKIHVEPHVESVRIVRPLPAGVDREQATVEVVRPGDDRTRTLAFSSPVSVTSEEAVTFRIHMDDCAKGPSISRGRRASLWPIVRRLAGETRDRIFPLVRGRK